MKNSPRSFQVALCILIPFILILFLTSVACKGRFDDLLDPNLQTPYTAQPKINIDRTLTARAADMEEMDSIRPTETPIIIPTVSPNPTQVAYVSGFVGSWDTNWGVMTCSVDGQRVSCNYTYDNGKIEATLGIDGTTMEGTWSEAPSYQPPEDGGRVTFSLSEDGNTITGSWWYGQSGEGGPWTGTRK